MAESPVVPRYRGSRRATSPVASTDRRSLVEVGTRSLTIAAIIDKGPLPMPVHSSNSALSNLQEFPIPLGDFEDLSILPELPQPPHKMPSSVHSQHPASSAIGLQHNEPTWPIRKPLERLVLDATVDDEFDYLEDGETVFLTSALGSAYTSPHSQQHGIQEDVNHSSEDAKPPLPDLQQSRSRIDDASRNSSTRSSGSIVGTLRTATIRDSTSTVPTEILDNSTVGHGSTEMAPEYKQSVRRPGRPNTAEIERAERMKNAGITDFFSPEVFQIVLRNPTTAYRLLKFCEKRACGENLAFLEKLDQYNRLLDDVAKLLGEIHVMHTSRDAKAPINITSDMSRRITSDIKASTISTIPSLEQIFTNAQLEIEQLLASDIYPRFVRHQVTTSATMALSDNKTRFAGLGDCFCLTNPNIADNPILVASDGFVEVTGYSRRDIVPRNCRFLQGNLTDRSSVRRLRASIDQCEETVELLLNYKKNGEPFWNLLYVSPLFDEDGHLAFFLGAQIDCSTTIHSCTDILKILSLPEDEDARSSTEVRPKMPLAAGQPISGAKSSMNFFKSLKNHARNDQSIREIPVRKEPGMEGELLDKIGKYTFKTQVEAFYTAYSKYVILRNTPGGLFISHHSPSIIDLLCLNLPNGEIASIYNKDLFKMLADNGLAPSTSAFKSIKPAVREAIAKGRAISLDMGLMTGLEAKRNGLGFGTRSFGSRSAGSNGSIGAGSGVKSIKVEERYVTHWTPLKDEEGVVRYVVLTVAPR